MGQYTREQTLLITTFAVANFCSAVCVSLQAPFYPQEAESKGATATQYGFVFGVFELTVFIVSPIYGRFLTSIGTNFMFTAGIFTTGTTCVLFGLLNFVVESTPFIVLSFMIRIVEALGNSAFLTASFSIIAKEFPETVSATFAIFETCFGVGLIAGPTIGGALYQVGGFTLPFVTLGSTLILSALFAICVLPPDQRREDTNPHNMLDVLKIPSIAIYEVALVATSFSVGFIQASLEPHIRPMHLTPFQTGLTFVLNGATYAIFAPIWGIISDRLMHPRNVICIGALVTCVAFTFIGPIPMVPLESSIWLCVGALLLHGVGFGAELVSTFGGSHREAILHGFPDDFNTYGLISGLWASSFAFGAFLGPTIAGYLLDTVGFRWGSMLVVVMHACVAVLMLTYNCVGTKPQIKFQTAEEKTNLISNGDHLTYGTDSGLGNSGELLSTVPEEEELDQNVIRRSDKINCTFIIPNESYHSIFLKMTP